MRRSEAVTHVTPSCDGRRARVHVGDSSEEYDAVIMATHTDTTLRMLDDDAPKVT